MDPFFPAGLGPATQKITAAVLASWPDHEKFLQKSFSGRSERLLHVTELIAEFLLKVAAWRETSLAIYAEDYRFLCEEIVFPEEVFFRREDRYRLSTFEEAVREVYDNAPLMIRYMNGLFVSNALWINHASAMDDFASVYLRASVRGGRHLEIGPGHGMLLYLANRFGNFGSLSAWDVSETSIDHTRHVLKLLSCSDSVDLQLQNMYDPACLANNRGRFDTVVLSEVLEHLERPREALEIIRDLLAPGGSVWVNVPANGPAPDHLFLLRSPEEAADLVASVGLEVVRTASFPLAGYSLERAKRNNLSISCIVVGRKAS